MKRALCLALLAFGCHDAEPGAEPASAPASAAPGASAVAASASAPAPVAECSAACSSIERCDKGKCVPNCHDGEVFVPATGEKGFAMGRGKPGESDQKHTVILSEPFCMDATEVTVAAYRKCVEAERCTLPQLRDQNSNYREEFQRDAHPLNMVNFQQAGEYCAYVDKRLPSEAQWEWAAGHGDGRTYPWGNEDPTCENGLADFTPGGSPHEDPAGNVGCHGGGSSPVKAHPKGKSSWPDGDLHDLGGNLWEWTRDCYLPYPSGTLTDPSPEKHPTLGDECYVRALRGGGWNRSKYGLRVFQRAGSKRTYRVPGLGFRCVREPT